MKKIISFFAAVTMLSTLFVSVVKADFQPTATTTVEKLTAEQFFEDQEEEIPEGYNAYYVTVDLSELGNLNCENTGTNKKPKYSGRKIVSFQYTMDFGQSVEDLIDKDGWTGFDSRKLPGASWAVDGNTIQVAKIYDSAETAYPVDFDTTISNASGISNAFTLLLLLDNSKTVTADLNFAVTINTYVDDAVSGESDVCNNATMVPASYTFEAAAAPVDPTPTPVYTDSEIDVKKPVSGTTGLTDLQGNEVALTANYGIAKFSKAIDIVANDYFVVATDSNDVEREFEVDFAAKGVEISNVSTTFFAIVKSADHIIKSIRLKEIAK